MKKRISKSANMYVMFGLLAVLFVSLGYLSMQSGREGMEDDKKEKDPNAPAGPPGPPASVMPTGTLPVIPPKQGFRGGRREGMCTAGQSLKGMTWDKEKNECA